MENQKGIYEVLSPWAEADPPPLKGLADRLPDLSGKKIGFFRNSKRAARPTFVNLEARLTKRFPDASFSEYTFLPNDDVIATRFLPEYEEWLKGMDAVIFAYGD
jgi:hypothetical protein